MNSELTSEQLSIAIGLVAEKMEACHDELNALDGQLGDGDLGVTMVNGFRNMREETATLPKDLGMALMKCAESLTRTGTSSYATLLATGFLAAAKEVRGCESVDWSQLPALLDAAKTKMSARGKSAVGDKTVIDAVDAAAKGSASAASAADMARAAETAVAERMDELRNEPCKQGRARIFADKSKGMDDPGMVAFKRVIEALST